MKKKKRVILTIEAETDATPLQLRTLKNWPDTVWIYTDRRNLGESSGISILRVQARYLKPGEPDPK